ncbi:MAG: TerC family protein [Kiritimatiellae bacterium]|jgi:tellurite resistance protein TerC|nr:TerC family protein [Kiritimatiellia bacterium]
MSSQALLWSIFGVFMFAVMAFDLGVFQRKDHTIGLKAALMRWGCLVAFAFIFNMGVWFWRGSEKALEFTTGYLIELSLSVDNVFVFLLIFSYFRVPSRYQPKVLFWGVLGALIMRALFIAAGITLVQKFHFIIYIFGAFLVLAGLKMAFQKDHEIHPEKNPLIKLFRRLMPVSAGYENGRFFVRRNGRIFATSLFIVLLIVETTDIIFAVDSIPAILSITFDPFIVYTSNVFAILGLRALYFVLAGIARLFCYLNYGLSAILAFVGVKMLLSDICHIPVGAALGVIFVILLVSITVSIIRPRKDASALTPACSSKDDPQSGAPAAG